MISSGKIRVLLADQRSFSRMMVTEILAGDSDIDLISTPAVADELLDKIAFYNPAVIYLDATLFTEQTFSDLRLIRSKFDQPIIIATSDIENTRSLLTAENLLGKVTLIEKYEGITGMRVIREDLVAKIKTVSRVTNNVQKKQGPSCLVVIGASTGGPQAIENVLKNIDSSFSGAILIAQHMPNRFISTFAKRLDTLSKLPVTEGYQGLLISPGQVIISPGEKNMFVSSHMGNPEICRIDLEDAQENIFDTPSVNTIMESGARLFQERTLGVILSGMGSDGTRGALAINKHGGSVIAQNEETSVIYGMARSAWEKGLVSKTLPLDKISRVINEFGNKYQPELVR